MPIFPRTRCPECGTWGDGRICPACRFALWRAAIHFRTPEGREGLVYLDEGYQLARAADKAALIEKVEPDGPDRIILIEPIDGGHAWLRWDGDPLLSDRDPRLKPAEGLPVEGMHAGRPAAPSADLHVGTRSGILGRLGWSDSRSKLEALAAEGAIRLEPVPNSKLFSVTVLLPEAAYADRRARAPARIRKKPEKSRKNRKKP